MTTPPSTLAPIALFVYNRYDELNTTLHCLKKNLLAAESLLYIFSDGPKSDADESQLKKIQAVRELCRSEQWCGTVHIIEREQNLGLSKSIQRGVAQVLEKHDKIIVLEDDLEQSVFFLQFMNDALHRYVDDASILSIGASNFFKLPPQTPDALTFSVPDCLGWATWSDRWSLFIHDGQHILNEITRLNRRHEFDLHSQYPFVRLLKKTIRGESSSWAILWYGTSFLLNKTNIYPKYSLTNHIGIGSAATHAANVDFSAEIIMAKNPLDASQLSRDPLLATYAARAYKKQYYKGVAGRLRNIYHRLVGILH